MLRNRLNRLVRFTPHVLVASVMLFAAACGPSATPAPTAAPATVAPTTAPATVAATAAPDTSAATMAATTAAADMAATTAAAAPAAATGSAANTAGSGTASVLNLGTAGTGDIPTADPALTSDTTSSQITTETHFELVRADETDLSKPMIPAMASKWDMSDGGKTITFHLRNDISWVKWDKASNSVVQVMGADGKPLMVTAKDFEYGIKRMLDPRTASNYAYAFTSIIVGADKFNAYAPPAAPVATLAADATADPNATPPAAPTADAAALQALSDAVGVKATDDTTLVINLQQPFAFALGVLSLPNVAATPKAAIDQYGDKWTEPGNGYSYGPYVISEWKHDVSMTLSKNPFWPGMENSPKPSIDKVVFAMIDTAPAFDNYQQGTIDVTAVPLAQIDKIKADASMANQLYTAPTYCTYYYGFNVTKAPVDDQRVRLALSEAVDRAAITKNVTKTGEPARWMGRPGLAFAPDPKTSPELGVGFDVADAKKQLQSYLDDKKITIDQFPALELTLNVSEGHAAIAQAVQQMWQDNLGIKATVTQQEWKVYLKSLSTDAPQIFRLGWCMDYADENNFLKDTFYSTSGQNNGKYNSPAYDKLVDTAAVETDPVKRADEYKQAETQLVKTDAAIIAMYWYTSFGVTKPYVHRTHALDINERLEKWTLDPH